MSFEKDTISKKYQEHIFANVPLDNGYPEFDLLYLGMGNDGHIGSIFKENISNCLQKEAVKFIERKDGVLSKLKIMTPTGVLLQPREKSLEKIGIRSSIFIFLKS